MSETRVRWHWLMGSRGLSASYQQCLRVCRAGDGILLLGQHVYLLADTGLLQPPENVSLYALAESVRSAGLMATVPPYIRLLEWSEVMALLERQYPLQQTWV